MIRFRKFSLFSHILSIKYVKELEKSCKGNTNENVKDKKAYPWVKITYFPSNTCALTSTKSVLFISHKCRELSSHKETKRP